MQLEPSRHPALAILASSGRALAASARRAGFHPWVIDCFGDADSRGLGTCRVVAGADGLRPDRALVRKAIQEAMDAGCEGVIPGGGVEWDVAALAELGQTVRLFGNTPAVFRTVTDPGRFFPLLARLGIPHPDVRVTPPTSPEGWLRKQGNACGGMGVARAGSPTHADHLAPNLDPRTYFQREVRGQPMSLLMLANGDDVHAVGWHLLDCGEPHAASSFAFRGARTCPPPDSAADGILQAARALTRALGLKGLNGLDFICTETGQWLLLEVNARPTATLALHDELWPGGLLAAHLAACEGRLPIATPDASPNCRGMRIVYATRAGIAPTLPGWPANTTDLPLPRTAICAGAPVCTVYAEGESQSCLMRQLERAEQDALFTCLPRAA